MALAHAACMHLSGGWQALWDSFLSQLAHLYFLSSPEAASDEEALDFFRATSYSAPFLQAPFAKSEAELGPLHVDMAGPQYKPLEAHPERLMLKIRARSRTFRDRGFFL